VDAVSTDTPRFVWTRTNPARAYEFINDIIGGSVPKEYIKPIDQGMQEAMEGGVLAGLSDGRHKGDGFTTASYHDVDSNEMAFKIAGSMAFKEAARKASPSDSRAGNGSKWK